MSEHEMQSKAALLKQQIDSACARYQDKPIAQRGVELIAVSKYQPVEAILEAKAAGFTLFGENKVQELCDKLADPRLQGTSFDFIGTLQSNKVKYVLGKVRLIHSLDRESLLVALEKRAEQLQIRQDVLIQVNYSQEASKHGLTQDGLPSFLAVAARCTHLRVRGLMTMAAPALSESQQLHFFQSFKQLFDDTRRALPQGIAAEHFDTLSMGMSDDFEAALAAGSNCVRIGRAIFGARKI